MEQMNWREKVFEWMCKLSVFFGIVLISCILVFLMSCAQNTIRFVNNRVLMWFVIGFALMIGILFVALCGRVHLKSFKHPILCMAGMYAFFYCLQAIWVYHTYFYVGWDASYMGWAAEFVLYGGSMADCSAEVVYSIYPNNLLPFYMLYLIEKVGTLFFPNCNDPYIFCVYASCLSVNLSCFLGHLIVRKLFRSGFMQVFYVLIAGIFFLTSPWSMVPYTDAFGILFVMLGMWGLLCCDRKYIRWIVVTFAAIIGYHVKPTAVFPLFVTYLLYGIYYILCLRKHWKELTLLIAGTICFWLIGLCIPLWIQYTFHAHLIPEYRITYHHYLMMGLNEETGGTYNDEDYWFSRMQPDVETRKKADMEVFWYRLDNLIKEGRLGQLLSSKAELNFDSGSMLWERDGALFMGGVEHDNALAELFDSFVSLEGKYVSVYMTLLQGIWQFVLFGILFTGIGGRAGRVEKACMMLVLCGLIVFVMIFEARARYLYLYTPVFLILSLCGYEAIYRKAAMLWSRQNGERLQRRQPIPDFTSTTHFK